LASINNVSVRVLWPFMRVVRDCTREFEILRAADIDPAVLADPDARLPGLLCRQLLIAWMSRTGNPALGILAGECIESADFGVMHHVVRNSPNVRQALFCNSRYLRLLDDGVEGALLEEGERGIWQIRNLTHRPTSVVNDFQVATAVTTLRSFLVSGKVPLEVHVRHEQPTSESEYERFFQAPVLFGREHNAVVVHKETLEAPVMNASKNLFSAFDHKAQRLLDQLNHSDGVEVQVRQLLLKRLDGGSARIGDVARQLHMSSATLRRRLAEHGTTHKHLLDQTRQELALHHMRESRLSIAEIAFLLGFSTQSAFGRAFRRWVGTSPIEYRAKLRMSQRLPSGSTSSKRA
jgi:AraC-like DNA-binding protein